MILGDYTSKVTEAHFYRMIECFSLYGRISQMDQPGILIARSDASHPRAQVSKGPKVPQKDPIKEAVETYLFVEVIWYY